METERLIIDPLKEADKEDYFTNISHDKRVLETFICKYAESLADFDFTPYLSANRAARFSLSAFTSAGVDFISLANSPG